MNSIDRQQGIEVKMQRLFGILLLLLLFARVAVAGEPAVEFALEEGRVEINVGGERFATYVYQDDVVLRPFFANVRAPSGTQVTRNFPPVEGQDPTDHADFHPGIWLAFGDLSGADFWRNKATVKHLQFVESPKGGEGVGTFTVQNRYEFDGTAICDETCTTATVVTPLGILILLDSTFTPGADLYFGDQEEMGLGIRVATPISVRSGGRIKNSDNLIDEKQVWGKQAEWCDYSGEVNGKWAGILMMPHRDNFRRSWFHARDYGLLVANPFGRNAFTGGEKSKVEVKNGEKLRLRFGLLIHDGEVEGLKAIQDYHSVALIPPTKAGEPAFVARNAPKTPTKVAGTYQGGELVELRVRDRLAYLIKPTGVVDPHKRWVWDFPFWLAINDGFGNVAHRYYVEQFLAAGFHVAGVDVGPSCGSPAAADVCQEFYQHVVSEHGLHKRARALAHSHGGLIAYGWAFRHPECVDRIAGMCPATDFRTYPTLPNVVTGPTKGLDYGLSLEELDRRSVEFNPIDNLAPLAKAHVKILHLHGDADTLIPTEANSRELARRYRELGGEAEIVLLKGLGAERANSRGHDGPELYESAALVNFLLAE